MEEPLKFSDFEKATNKQPKKPNIPLNNKGFNKTEIALILAIVTATADKVRDEEIKITRIVPIFKEILNIFKRAEKGLKDY